MIVNLSGFYPGDNVVFVICLQEENFFYGMSINFNI